MSAESDLDAFRAQVRAWCSSSVPRGWETSVPDAGFIDFQREWFQTLRRAGYAVPHWPAEWGGGLSLPHRVVLFEELARADAPRATLFTIAIYHVAGTLLAHGSPEQVQRHLPAILDGEVWCQGFSEPAAGSDLASLRTRATRDGDQYVVSGQKVWSSLAMHADWCLLLVRTDPEAPKRKGISLLLLDLRTPGVDIRPIRKANGQAEFCEIFLDDVVVPVENRVGAENDGWRVAQSTLSDERGTQVLDLVERMPRALEKLVATAAEVELGPGRRAIDDPGIRERLTLCHTDIQLVRLLCRRMIDNMVHRGGVGPEASVIKVYYADTLARLNSLGLEIAGLDVLRFEEKPLGSSWESGRWFLDYLSAWEWIIGGGTNEIQRNVIAERVLGLPREPSAA